MPFPTDLMNNIDFRLNEMWVSPDDLVLDPHNPRLQTSIPDRPFSDEEIVSEAVQRYVIDQIRSKEHGVGRLVDSLQTNGFINIDSIFVKRLSVSNKFVVLEGNRRTTAIKHLLENSHELTPSVRESLEKIPVKELICDDETVKDDKTALILAIRHLGGVKEWAPMQQAYQIYTQYTKELVKSTGSSVFIKETKVVSRIAQMLNVDTKQVLKALRIYVAFTQLKKKDYMVKSDHYSLLDLAVSHYPSMRKEFFQVSETNFELSNLGLERFNSLCIEEGCRIKNPAVFRDFYHIFRDGSERELMDAFLGEEDISELKNSIGYHKKTNFYSSLQDVKKSLGKLVVSKYNRSEKERLLILEIKHEVDEKLLPLIN